MARIRHRVNKQKLAKNVERIADGLEDQIIDLLDQDDELKMLVVAAMKDAIYETPQGSYHRTFSLYNPQNYDVLEGQNALSIRVSSKRVIAMNMVRRVGPNKDMIDPKKIARSVRATRKRFMNFQAMLRDNYPKRSALDATTRALSREGYLTQMFREIFLFVVKTMNQKGYFRVNTARTRATGL